MINIVSLYESIQSNNYFTNVINMNRSFPYLHKFDPKTFLIIGSKPHPKYNTIDSFNLEDISREMDKYKLFVLDKYFCVLPNNEISEILDLFNAHKKKLIVIGYTCYTNLNINNTNNMFRPIDVTKYPFNQSSENVLYKRPSIKLILLYIFCSITIVAGYIKEPKLLYKIVLLILILVPLIFPLKKVILIDYSSSQPKVKSDNYK